MKNEESFSFFTLHSSVTVSFGFAEAFLRSTPISLWRGVGVRLFYFLTLNLFSFTCGLSALVVGSFSASTLSEAVARMSVAEAAMRN